MEQTLPGEEEPTDEVEAERRGLPDGLIHDNCGWALIIESKIQSALTSDQLQRHRRTAEKRGFTDLDLLALVATPPAKPHTEAVAVRRRTEVYTWMLEQRSSLCAREFASYREVLERRLIRDESLREGMLTVFSGIPFGKSGEQLHRTARRTIVTRPS
jgi:hypothetical protein